MNRRALPHAVPRVTVYFDYGSPYAYLAWQRIVHVHPERYRGAEVVWTPASAGHLFKMDGSRSNVTMRNQKRHLLADVGRWANLWGVPFAPPPDDSPGAMPVRSLDAMRLHFAVEREGESAVARWMSAVFLAHFRDGRDISDRSVLADLLRTTGVETAVDAADDPEHRGRLVANTEAAYAAGAPGVPYAILDGEGYWGNDRLDWVEARLAGTRPSGT